MNYTRDIVAKVLLIIGVLSCFHCCANAAEGDNSSSQKLWVEKTTLQMHNTQGYKIFKIPTLCVSKAGTVMAIFEGRVGGRLDETETNIVVRKSYDSGKTWSPLQVIYKEPGHNMTIGNPVPVVDYETGTIWVFFCRNNRDVLVSRSDDDGVSWQSPADLTKELRRPEQQGFYATGPCHGIQLKYGDKKGRLVIPSYAGTLEPQTEPGAKRKSASRSFIIYSDDHGKTWSSGGATYQSKPNAADGNECMVV